MTIEDQNGWQRIIPAEIVAQVLGDEKLRVKLQSLSLNIDPVKGAQELGILDEIMRIIRTSLESFHKITGQKSDVIKKVGVDGMTDREAYELAGKFVSQIVGILREKLYKQERPVISNPATSVTPYL